LAGIAVEVAQPAGGLGHRGVPGSRGVGTGLPVSRHPHQDEAAVAGAQRIVVQPPALQRAGAEILDDDVAALDQLQEQVPPARRPDVEGEAFLVARVHRPEEPVSVEFGLSPGAQRVGPARQLDLDHLGAHVGQQPRAVGAGDQGAQFEHSDAFECSGGVIGDHRASVANPRATNQTHCDPGASKR
jgi:hypothetical protein